MPADLYYDTLEVDIEALEADEPTPESYPLPRLRRSGRTVTVSLRTAVLENEYLQGVFALDLGGRLIQLVDRRTTTEVLALPLTELVTDGSVRGAWCPIGLQWLLGDSGGNLATIMGPVDHLAEEPDGERPAALTLFTTLPPLGTDLSWTWNLAPDSAELICTVNWRVRWRGGPGARLDLRVDGLPPWSEPYAVGEGVQLRQVFQTYDPVRRAGLALICEPHFLDEADGQVLRGQSGWAANLLGNARRTSFALQPLSSFDGVDSVDRPGAIGRVGDSTGAQLTRPLESAKVVVRVRGHAQEAEFDPSPGPPRLFDLAPLGEVEVLAVVSSGEVKVQRPPRLVDADFGPHIQRATATSTRVDPLLSFAYDALERRDFTEADYYLEEALLYAGDDPLLWWRKALVQRVGGLATSDDRPELLNAHFLAPLEPALRAEAFLQVPSHHREPSPLMRPLAEDPEALLDVLCHLLVMHQVEEASRLMDEALRHREVPLIRYLFAATLVRQTRMKAEAASHVAIAEKSPIGPPYPWRALELDLLEGLSREFPSAHALAERLCLAARWRTSQEGQ